jgi:hypothetical protein
MKVASFLLILGASLASACSHYGSCHCFDSDGTPNNAATTSVCYSYNGQGSLQNDTTDYGDSTPYLECYANEGCWQNCNWRRHCQGAGATGDDSSCNSKCTMY